ncbi:MAG: FMN-binding negative transcriptional regulator, partial [Pseudobdellovibrionaceae bacterium]
VSHVPLIAERTDEGLVLLGHLARANPHWKVLVGKPAYIIFNGPNSYITPKWYVENDVPTWNYAVMHIEGVCSLIQDAAGIQSCLKKMTVAVESGAASPWEFWIPEDLAGEGALEKAIVGFAVKVTSIKAKFKLSQNRSEADREGVVSGLRARTDEMSHEVAALMSKAKIGRR